MEARAPNQCEHETTEIRRKLDRSGRPMYRRQCLGCGSGLGSNVAKKDVPVQSLSRDWDARLEQAGEEARTRFWQEQRETSARARELKNNEWWVRHSHYLTTPRWRLKRNAVIERDKICQACRSRPATEAHHLTYDHMGDEPLFDLVGVCHPCHEKITQMDRARRAG